MSSNPPRSDAGPGDATARKEPGVAFEAVLVGVTQLVIKLRALITLPLIAGRLGEASYGLFAQVLAMTTLLAHFTGLCLHIPLIRYGAETRSRTGELFATYVLTVLGLMSVLMGIALVWRGHIAWLFLGDAQAANVVMSSLALVLAANLRQLVLGVYRVEGRVWLVSVTQFVVSLVGMIALLGCLVGGHGLDDAIRAWAGVETVTAVAMAAHVYVVTRLGRPTRDALAIGLRLALPLLPSTIAMWIIDRFDRFALGHFRGLAAVGVYSAHYAIASLSMMVVTPLSTVVMPRISALWSSDRSSAFALLDQCIDFFVAFAVLFASTAPWLSGPLLAALSRESFARGAFASTLVLSLGATAWGISLLQAMALYAAKDTGAAARANGIGALVNALVCLAAIPTFGALGAAYATLIAFVVVVLVQRRTLVEFWPTKARGAFVARCVLAAVPHTIGLVLYRPDGLVAVVATGLAVVVVYLVSGFGLGIWSRSTLALFARSR